MAERLGARFEEPFVANTPRGSASEVHRLQKQAEIKLPNLKVATLIAWVKAVTDFESNFGPYNRRMIEPDIKQLISDRWTDDIYNDCLPANCKDVTLARDSWIFSRQRYGS